jgi:hypothetical protein
LFLQVRCQFDGGRRSDHQDEKTEKRQERFENGKGYEVFASAGL